MRLLITLLLFLSFVNFSESVYRVRKLVRQPGTRRAATDDDDVLDLEAAELIFKEKGLNKEPFGDTHKIEVKPEKMPIKNEIGAPASQPTVEQLRSSMTVQPIPPTTTTVLPVTTEILDFENIEGQESELITTTTEIPFDHQTIGPNGEIPFDFNTDPDFPQSAPFARGLVGIPDGWNTDKQIDEEFRRGFRTSNFKRHVHANK